MKWYTRIGRNVIANVTLLFIIEYILIISVGRSSVVGTATGYGVKGPGIESRWGAIFSTPVQTGPGAYSASYTMVTGSLSRG